MTAYHMAFLIAYGYRLLFNIFIGDIFIIYKNQIVLTVLMTTRSSGSNPTITLSNLEHGNGSSIRAYPNFFEKLTFLTP